MDYFLLIFNLFALLSILFALLSIIGIIPKKIQQKVYRVFFYFTYEEKKIRENKKEYLIQKNIRENGTHEEKISLHNQLNPNYKFLTDDQIKEKYKGVDFSKVIIVDLPNNLFCPDENEIITSDHFDYFNDDRTKILTSVRTHSKLDTNKLNNSECVIIFRQDTNNYRYITKEEII